MIWNAPSTLACALPQYSQPLLAIFMIDSSGSVKLVWALSAGVSTIGPGSRPRRFVPVRCRSASASSRRCRSASAAARASAPPRFVAASTPAPPRPLPPRLHRPQPTPPPTQLLGQLIATPRAQHRLILGIDGLGLLQ